jgi:predicted DNA-binding protein
MAITLTMPKITMRSTFALDPETVESLDRLARHWAVSKSETLRRVVNAAAVVEEMDAAADALAALDDVQETLGLGAAQAEAWVAEIRAQRAAASP